MVHTQIRHLGQRRLRQIRLAGATSAGEADGAKKVWSIRHSPAESMVGYDPMLAYAYPGKHCTITGLSQSAFRAVAEQVTIMPSAISTATHASSAESRMT